MLWQSGCCVARWVQWISCGQSASLIQSRKQLISSSPQDWSTGLPKGASGLFSRSPCGGPGSIPPALQRIPDTALPWPQTPVYPGS